MPQFIFSQNDKKIDSVFQHYFKIVEIELKQDNLMNYPDLYEEISLGNGEKGYINKYLNEAIVYFEKISKIKAPKEKKGINVVSIVNKDVLNKWKAWYVENEERISWCEKKSKPKISFWRRLFG